MTNFKFAVAAMAAAVSAMTSLAQARPVISTSYSYYAVSGSTLHEVYRSMVSRAPSAAGTKGFGVTTASPGNQMSVASCKASGRYKIGINVNIRLPRANGSGLSSSESAQWNGFVSFVKRHEETHRTIWLGCASDLERKFQAIAPADCGAAHAKAMALWRQTVSSCMPRQLAFDSGQRSVLRAHPFMKYASR